MMSTQEEQPITSEHRMYADMERLHWRAMLAIFGALLVLTIILAVLVLVVVLWVVMP
jgi:cell division septal protein FtsQ